VSIDPGLASVLLAFGLGGLCSLPSVHRALRRRRDLKPSCLSCGRKLVQGVRQCACDL
jgi:hypothetical protein